MPQTGRTPTEQWFLSEQLRSEDLSLKKASIYARQTDDPKLRSMCEKFRDLHEKNVKMLSKFAGEGVAEPGAGGLMGVAGEVAHEITTPPALDTLTIVSAVFSLGIALLGIAVGWLFYGRRPLVAGQADPLARLGPVWTWLRNKYYLDELYGIRINPNGSSQTGLLERFVVWFSDLLFHFDQRVVDGLVNLAGLLGRAFSFISGLFDRWVVDGVVNGVGQAFGISAGELRLIQTGRVQNYLLLALLGAAIFALIFMARALI